MSKRSLRLNGTEDEKIEKRPLDGVQNDGPLETLRFHPLCAGELLASVQRKREALTAAARTTIPSVAQTIERLKACPDGIDPTLALRTAELLRAALSAIQEALVLDGVEDRDSINRLKEETQALQLRLTEAVEKIVGEASGSILDQGETPDQR